MNVLRALFGSSDAAAAAPGEEDELTPLEREFRAVVSESLGPGTTEPGFARKHNGALAVRIHEPHVLNASGLAKIKRDRGETAKLSKDVVIKPGGAGESVLEVWFSSVEDADFAAQHADDKRRRHAAYRTLNAQGRSALPQIHWAQSGDVVRQLGHLFPIPFSDDDVRVHLLHESGTLVFTATCVPGAVVPYSDVAEFVQSRRAAVVLGVGGLNHDAIVVRARVPVERRKRERERERERG